MRIGLTGVGRIGVMHATNLTRTAGVSELVLQDPLPGRAEAVAAQLNAAVVSSAVASSAMVVRAVTGPGARAELLQSVDGVVVATPTPTHAEVVHAALAAGVPTLVEKPVTGDLASMREVAAHAQRSGVPLLVGFQRRFDPAITELKRRIVSGELGDLYYLRALAFDHEPPAADYIPTSGGIFRDLFIHDLDCVPWLVGRPVVQVQAVGSVLVDPLFAAASDVDTAAITLVFEGGVIAQIAGGRRDGTGYDNRIEAVGSRQSVTSGLDGRSPITSLEPGGHDPARSPSGPYLGFQERYAVAYAREVATFLDVIAGRVANPSPPAESLTSLAIAQACEVSLRTGAPVTLDPAQFSIDTPAEAL